MGDDVCVAEVREWAEGLAEVGELIGARFARSEPRANAVEYVKGLLSEAERKNSWTLSERAGHRVLDRMQRLLSSTDWDPDGLRDDLRSYVVERIGEADGVLVVDETGFLKKGKRSAGVARQYSGTAGRIENCQIGVFLTYATGRGRTFLDRELYLPREWTDDPDRCADAGVPEGRVQNQACAGDRDDRARLGRRRAGEVGGRGRGLRAVPRLRRTLEERGLFYGLAVPVSQRVVVKDGSWLGTQKRADAAVVALAPTAWRTRSAGDGSKGVRDYAWARVRTNGAEVAYFICHAPQRVALAELARIAGIRWAIEETFQTAKGQDGLDYYQVRQYTGWYRHVTLSMLAHAFLTALRAKKGGAGSGQEGLVALSLPEIRHLITRLAWARIPDPHHVLDRSRWRRKHQYNARTHHYRKRQERK